MPETHKRHKESTVGPESAVKCPWCSKRNDHRKLADLGGRDAGTRIECDHCENYYVVVGVQTQPIISVKQYHGEG